MELSAVDSEERLEEVKEVWDKIAARNQEIREYLHNLEMSAEINEDAFSELSDPFSDMGDSELVKSANKVLHIFKKHPIY